MLRNKYLSFIIHLNIYKNNTKKLNLIRKTNYNDTKIFLYIL